MKSDSPPKRYSRRRLWAGVCLIALGCVSLILLSLNGGKPLVVKGMLPAAASGNNPVSEVRRFEVTATMDEGATLGDAIQAVWLLNTHGGSDSKSTDTMQLAIRVPSAK